MKLWLILKKIIKNLAKSLKISKNNYYSLASIENNNINSSLVAQNTINNPKNQSIKPKRKLQLLIDTIAPKLTMSVN